MRILSAMLFVLLAACAGEQTPKPTYHADENPQSLRDWGMVTAHSDGLVLSENVQPYDLATPLFTDYALKLRTIWMPEGQSAQYRENDVFDFPVGTVITKTFYYSQEGAEWNNVVLQKSDTDEHTSVLINGALPLKGIRLIETRILVRRETGWDALPYVWNEEQTDAVLQRAGALKPMTLVRADGRREPFPYVAPNANQCAGCHAVNSTTKAIHPIGPKARHLNKTSTFAAGSNQLDHWSEAKLVTGAPASNAAPQNADWTNLEEPLEARARAYLDSNCSHCHSPSGPADTSGLNLEPDAQGPALGNCKSPIAAGRGSGGRPYSIVPGDPDASITVFRMETTDPGAMMPELGRAVSHEEGVALIAEWIAAMDGGCA